MSTPVQMPSQDQRPAEMLSVSQALTVWLKDAVKTWMCLMFLSFVGMASSIPFLELFEASDEISKGGTEGSHKFPKMYVVMAVCTSVAVSLVFPVIDYKRAREMPLIAGDYRVVGKTVGTSVVFFLAGLTVYFPENTWEAVIFVLCTSLFLFSLIAHFRPNTDFGVLYFCLGQCVNISYKLWDFGVYTVLMYILCVFIALLRNILEDRVPVPIITTDQIVLEDERNPLLPIQLPRTTDDDDDATTSKTTTTTLEDPKNKDSTQEVLTSKNGKGVSTRPDKSSPKHHPTGRQKPDMNWTWTTAVLMIGSVAVSCLINRFHKQAQSKPVSGPRPTRPLHK